MSKNKLIARYMKSTWNICRNLNSELVVDIRDNNGELVVERLGVHSPNARLIAAAPEMLALLKDIAADASPYRSECGFCEEPGTSSKDDNSDWEETHEEDCTLLEIRRLISKAEGTKK